MHTLQQRRIFEKLRGRFGVAERRSFALSKDSPKGAGCFPNAILKTGLHECLGAGPGDWPSVLGFALSAVRQAQEAAPSLFVVRLKSTQQELGELYGHGLAVFGLDAAKVITVTVNSEKDLLWAAEEIAENQAQPVIAMLNAKERLYGFTASRRLKLRSEGAGSLIFIVRHWSQEGATAAHTRWRITRQPSLGDIKTPGTPLVGSPRLMATLERGHGWSSSQWEIALHASAGLRMAPLLADRTPRAEQPSRHVA